jgi:ATP-binding cassette subfamily B multidrug efflux pump
VEQGTHAELLASGGIYARLWAHQSGGFLGEEAA